MASEELAEAEGLEEEEMGEEEALFEEELERGGGLEAFLNRSGGFLGGPGAGGMGLEEGTEGPLQVGDSVELLEEGFEGVVVACHPDMGTFDIDVEEIGELRGDIPRQDLLRLTPPPHRFGGPPASLQRAMEAMVMRGPPPMPPKPSIGEHGAKGKGKKVAVPGGGGSPLLGAAPGFGRGGKGQAPPGSGVQAREELRELREAILRDAPVVTLRREFSALSPSRDGRADPRTQFSQTRTLPVPVSRQQDKGGNRNGGKGGGKGGRGGGESPKGSSPHGKRQEDGAHLELFLELEEPAASASKGKGGGGGSIDKRSRRRNEKEKKESVASGTPGSSSSPCSSSIPGGTPVPLGMTAFQAVQQALKSARGQQGGNQQDAKSERLRMWEPVYRLVYRSVPKERIEGKAKSPSGGRAEREGAKASYWPLEEVESKLGSREMPKAALLTHLRETAPKDWLKSYNLLNKKADKRYNCAYLLGAYRDLVGAPQRPLGPQDIPASPIQTPLQGQPSSPEILLRPPSTPRPTITEGSCAQALHVLSIIARVVEHEAAAEARSLYWPEKRQGGGGEALRVLTAGKGIVNERLTTKLKRQLQDPVSLCSGALPGWCDSLVKQLRPLVALEARASYFSYTAFGVSRSLFQLGQDNEASRGAMQRWPGDGQLTVERVEMPRRVTGRSAAEVGTPARDRAEQAGDIELLAHTSTALEMYASRKTMLQFKVAGEEGTGEGPTRQFYTDVAAALQRKSLCLWRCDHESAGPAGGEKDSLSRVSSGRGGSEHHVFRPEGLFPAVLPLDKDAAAECIERFTLLGRLLARALQDGHLVDLPLSAAWRKVMTGGRLSISDLADVDVAVAKVILPLHKLVGEKRAIEAREDLSLKAKRDLVGQLRVGGLHSCSIEDLSLSLCYDQVEPSNRRGSLINVARDLVPGGSEMEVDLDTVELYVERVTALLLLEGIEKQVEAFAVGFNEVFPLRQLRIFSPEELAIRLGGESSLDWTVEELEAAITPQHGYDAESEVYRSFLDMMIAMAPQEKRDFLTWITGCPRQPVGGLAALRPKMTFLRKDAPQGMPVEETMPSAQTCHHIVKMPPYADPATMRSRLVAACTNPDVQQFLFN